MPEFEEYIDNSSLILTTVIAIRDSVRRLSITYFPLPSVYMRLHAFLKRHVPFSVQNLLLELNCTSASHAVVSTSDTGCMYRNFCQNVCFSNFSGDQCLVLTTCQLSYVYVFIEVEGPV